MQDKTVWWICAGIIACGAFGALAGHERTDTDRDSTRDTFPNRVIPPGFVNHPTWCGNRCDGEWDAMIATKYRYTQEQVAARYPWLLTRHAAPPPPVVYRRVVPLPPPRPVRVAVARPHPRPAGDGPHLVIANRQPAYDPSIIASLRQLFFQ